MSDAPPTRVELDPLEDHDAHSPAESRAGKEAPDETLNHGEDL